MKKMLFLMNPYAGMRRANRYLTDIITTFNRAGYRVEIHMTEGPGDGARYVEEHGNDADLIVCCGGDGTFNEMITGVRMLGRDIPVGYIPSGSTNDFAASIHLPLEPMKAAQTAVEGSERTLDIGKFGLRYFSYVASFGAFTRASYATPQYVKNALGHAAYVLEGISEISQIQPYHVKLELDDEILEDDFLFGAISNSTSVGGILTLDEKQVDMNDGKFEILLVRAPQDILEVGECIHALRNQTYNCAMITFRSAEKVVVTAPDYMDWTLDGELAKGCSEPIEIENLHNGIRVIVENK